MNLAQDAAARITAHLREAEETLGRLAERPLVKALDPRQCDPIVAEFVRLNPDYTTLGIRDRQGSIVCSYLPKPIPQLNVGDFPWFEEGLRAGRFTVGDAFLGRQTGRWVSVLTYPVRDDAKALIGLLVLPIDLARLNERLLTGVPEEAVVAVVDRKRAVVLRSSDFASFVGKSAPARAEDATRGVREGFLSTMGLDGVQRLYAFVTLPGIEWRIVAGVAEAQAFAGYRTRLRRSLVVSLAVLLLGLGLAWRIAASIAQPIAGLARTSARIASGDRGARAEVAGLPEIATVALRFNRMLDALDRSEAAVRESEERYRELFMANPHPMWVYDLESLAFLAVNDAAIVHYGYRREEFLAMTIKDIRPAEDVGRLLENVARVSKGVDEAGVWRHLKKDGSVIEVEITSHTLRYEGRAAEVVLAHDVTQRRRAEAALRESEQRFRALVDLSADFYWVTDAEHRFTLRAGEILRRMRLPPEVDYGKTRWELETENMSEADWAAHRAVLERREEFRDLLSARRGQSGRLYWAEISGRPLFDAAGKFIGYHGTGRDVTAQVEAEQALRQLNAELEAKVAERTRELAAANRELEAFSYNVSHDLRAPLRGIDGFSTLLASEHARKLDPEAQRLLERIRANAQRMGALITDLLKLAQVGRSTVHPVQVDLSALAAEVAAELAPEPAKREVEWRIEPGMKTTGDPGLLRIALANLLGNAYKYSRNVARARIEFDVRARAAGRTEYFVRDNGVGFDMAYAERLFEPFQRLHGIHEFEGAGIGLATVKRIIEKHGGTVSGWGRPGEGATFIFSLPD
jgi:PAS domain S-box-containing protein